MFISITVNQYNSTKRISYLTEKHALMRNNLYNFFTKKIKSKYSGILEITWLNGKKVLNSENANYSYGALDSVLDFGLSRVHADRSTEILILGLGGGNIIELLRKKFRYYGKITAVEIDPVIIDIAITEFKIKIYEPLELICEDALEYVKGNSGQFGLIVIDIFIDWKVPVQFYPTQFWEHISSSLKDDGVIIFNVGINSANRPEIDQLLKVMKSQIVFKKMETGTNIILLGCKKQ